MKCFLILNFSYDLCSIFEYRLTSIFGQFLFKICKRDFKIFFKIPIFDISLIYKKPSYRFLF